MSRSQVIWALVKNAYTELVTYGVPGPASLSYFVPFVLLPTALLIPPERLSKGQAITFFLVPIYGAIVHAWTVMGGVDVISADVVLWSTFLIAYKDPKKDFKRLWDEISVDQLKPSHSLSHKPPNPKQIAQAYPKELGERIAWVATLLASTRLHRWKIGEESHDRVQDNCRAPSRTKFLMSLLPCLLSSLTIYPFVIQLAQLDPNVTSLKTNGPVPDTISKIRELLPMQVLSPLVCGLYTYCTLSGGFLYPVPVVILTNYLFNFPTNEWSPHTLPAYFGSFSSVLDHGVTGLWGTWWHQHMRVMVSFPGRALGDFLRAGPFARYTLQVVSAFLFSGITHMGLVPPGAPDAMMLRLQVAGFFWLQAFAVLFEAVVARAWCERGLSKWSWTSSDATKIALRAARLLWTVSWMCLTLNLLILPADRLNWWAGWRLWPVPGLSHWLLPYTSGQWIP